MPSHVTEEQFEKDVVESLVTSGGYNQGHDSNYQRSNSLDAPELFAFINGSQEKGWAELVKRHGGDAETARTKFQSRLVSELDQRGTIDVLRRGIEDQGVKFDLAFSRPASGLNPTVLEQYAKNRLTVTRQVHYSSDNANSIDLVLFVNGLPVATVELKSEINGQNVTDAITQYQLDRDPSDALLGRRAVVHFAVDQHLVYMTTHLKGEATEFMPFNRGSNPGELSCGKGNPPNPAGYATAYLWESVWQYDNWLDILLRFTEESYEGSAKNRTRRVIFPRYHQWNAVVALEQDALSNGPGQSYLIQHSAGSGKSNTIAWLGHRLSVLHDPADKKVFHKIVVVTDRRVLDEQLSATVQQFESVAGTIFTVQGKRGPKSAELAEALTGPAQIVTVTLETFPYVIERIADADLASRSYAIIVDEAHSSQTGDAASALKQALGAGSADDEEGRGDFDSEDTLADVVAHRGRQPNLSFFAFTGTPKERTVELFGTSYGDGTDKRPFHLYTMRQAIEEGFILDVLENYVTYKTYFRLAATTDAVGLIDVPHHEASAALRRYVSRNPTLIREKAAIIVEHFRNHTSKQLGGRAKAMVVTDSRAGAVRYKRAVDAHIAEYGYIDVHALVAFSGEIDGDTESSLNGFPESQTSRRFKGDAPYSPGDWQLLIVAEKYQTGFDEPYLHTMFVDKPLSGLNAVQTLSRLNRIAPGKDETFVLDFRNEATDIQRAFQRFYEAVVIEPTDVNVLYDLRGRMLGVGILSDDEIGAASDAYFGLEAAKRNLKLIYANIDPALVRFSGLTEDEQSEFRDALDQFIRVYAFLSQVMPFTDAALERLYVYGKATAACLPSQATGRLDVGRDVVLTHLRITADEAANIPLEPDQVTTRKVLPGEGRGGAWEDEQQTFASVIEEINERFGLELDSRDVLESEKLKLTLLGDDELASFAKNNSLDNFALEFANKWKLAILEQVEHNRQLYELFQAKPEIAAMLQNAIMTEVYKSLRGDGQPDDDR